MALASAQKQRAGTATLLVKNARGSPGLAGKRFNWGLNQKKQKNKPKLSAPTGRKFIPRYGGRPPHVLRKKSERRLGIADETVPPPVTI